MKPPAYFVACAAVTLALLAAGIVGNAAAPASAIRFREIAAQAGISFVLENHPTPEKHLIETIPGGVAVLDYDGDGRPDIYFANGADIPSLEKSSPKYWNRLYRNEGNWKFRDVTEEAGVAGAGYSMGVAAADYDNDGRPDLFVAGVNRNTLYHNLGNGRFEDVTAKAGIRSGEWAVAAGWFDYDRDGNLDLWVVHYAKWSPSFDRYCGDATRGVRIYCHPKYFEGLASTLYRNRGDGTFEDVTARAGLARYVGRGMSLGFADYDQDGYPDVFVTNDNMPNFLFHNKGDGTFEEVALAAGTSLRDDGKPISSMGTEFKDYDNDGLPDIVVTALAGETFPVFRNRGKGSFVDATYASRMGPASVKHSGWGLGLFDFNNDGWKDLFTANSHVNDRVEAFEAATYREANAVFANEGGTFRDVSAEAGLAAVKAHRGAAFADFDGDGRIDAVVSALGEPAELWQNVSPEAGHWIVLRLQGVKDNRDGIGARIRIGSQVNEMTTTVGYASSADSGVHFGLGKLTTIPKIEIRWPGGAVQTLTGVAADQVLTVKQGK
ncbi:ASPIC/UnbV domain protein [Candidatus Sulfopaludibacter sp. SbA4]|nr:ASPIC/UnbV domain protein [Candidatus Sulfopaludibacter sp. SbA4]